MSKKIYTIICVDEYGTEQWRLGPFGADRAETEAREESQQAPEGHKIFITCGHSGYLNHDGHSPVGSAW